MLNQANRLKKTKDFQRVYQHGAFVASRQMVIYYYPLKNSDGIRAGFVASKKVGKSHQRNRCKRLLREAMRQHLPNLVSGYDLVVVARPSLNEEDFRSVNKIMARLLRKAKLLWSAQWAKSLFGWLLVTGVLYRLSLGHTAGLDQLVPHMPFRLMKSMGLLKDHTSPYAGSCVAIPLVPVAMIR